MEEKHKKETDEILYLIRQAMNNPDMLIKQTTSESSLIDTDSSEISDSDESDDNY